MTFNTFAKMAEMFGPGGRLKKPRSSTTPREAASPAARTPPAPTPRQSSWLSREAAKLADFNLAAMLKAAGGVPTTLDIQDTWSTGDYLATPELIIKAGEVRRSESQITTDNIQALRILAAAEFARGEHSTEVPLPTDAVAKAIVLAARKRDLA